MLVILVYDLAAMDRFLDLDPFLSGCEMLE